MKKLTVMIIDIRWTSIAAGDEDNKDVDNLDEDLTSGFIAVS